MVRMLPWEGIEFSNFILIATIQYVKSVYRKYYVVVAFWV